MWIAYLILIHLLAVPGAYMAVGVAATFFLVSTTNPLTGQTLPWANGIGWFFVGCCTVALAVFSMKAWGVW